MLFYIIQKMVKGLVRWVKVFVTYWYKTEDLGLIPVEDRIDPGSFPDFPTCIGLPVPTHLHTYMDTAHMRVHSQ